VDHITGSTRMMAGHRTATMLLSLVLVAILTMSLSGGAGAQPPPELPGEVSADLEGGEDPELPPDWSLAPTPRGLVLAWENGDVQVGGARPEFRLDEEVLAFPRSSRTRSAESRSPPSA
jgi:hypothetical protein